MGIIKGFDLDNPIFPVALKPKTLSSGGYPYQEKMKRKLYEDELRALQIELLKLQSWVRETGTRIVIVFEGRDAAGKGGTIKRFMQHLNPRHARTVALSKPTETERGQWYFQRYITHLPTQGDIVLFDRSWYNRSGVERVMNFCTNEQLELFFQEVPHFESSLVRDGIHLFKYWLTVGREMQLKRFHDRRHDPLKQWKLSDIDIASLSKWEEYTEARDDMFKYTHTDITPWTVIKSNDKRRARIEAIRNVLLAFEYKGKDHKAVGDIDKNIIGSNEGFFQSA